jgi:hypothetical protein
MYLRYDWNYIEFRNQNRTVDSSNSLQIFQWNIRDLRSKTDKLINSFKAGTINPNVLCFSEHNMEEFDPLHLILPGNILGSIFCRQSLQKWGVCIFVCEYLYSKINISGYCQEKGFGNSCHWTRDWSYELIVSSWYRVPQKDFDQFIKKN